MACFVGAGGFERADRASGFGCWRLVVRGGGVVGVGVQRGFKALAFGDVCVQVMVFEVAGIDGL